jgi:hypothetical protein
MNLPLKGMDDDASARDGGELGRDAGMCCWRGSGVVGWSRAEERKGEVSGIAGRGWRRLLQITAADWPGASHKRVT